MDNTQTERVANWIYPGDRIPEFTTEEEEAFWWDEHELSDEALAQMQPFDGRRFLEATREDGSGADV